MEVDPPQNLSYLGSIPVPTVYKPASYDEHRSQHTPLCIDNGSTTMRFGFCTSDTPRTGTNMVAKYKERRTNRPLLLFGEGIDAEGGARSQAKSPWEGDVLLNFDAMVRASPSHERTEPNFSEFTQENALDYAFIHLGIDTPTVDHPIIMTERLASPLHSRARKYLALILHYGVVVISPPQIYRNLTFGLPVTSELMFEQYTVPSLAYCVDSVMSFYHNNLPSPPVPFTSDGLVVSFNTASTSIIPILDGKGLMSHAKRYVSSPSMHVRAKTGDSIPWGTMQATDYLTKLIQLKYPTFPTRVVPAQSNVRRSLSCPPSSCSPKSACSGCSRSSASSRPITPRSSRSSRTR